MTEQSSPLKRSKVKILKAGHYVKNGHKFSITSKTIKQFISNFRDASLSTKDLPVFVGHAVDGKEAPAVAWIKDLLMSMDVNGATWLSAEIEWTNEELAADIKKNNSYKYVSIEAALNDKHPNTGEDVGAVLSGLALTNKPFIRELPEIELSVGKKADSVYLSTQMDLKLEAPPGMEDLVEELKKQYPGDPEKAFATAWAIYNGTVEQDSKESTKMTTEPEVKLEQTEVTPPAANPLLEALRSGMNMPEMTEEEAIAHVAEMCAMMQEAKSELKAAEETPAKEEEEVPAKEESSSEVVVEVEAPTEEDKEEEGKDEEEALGAQKVKTITASSLDATTAIVMSLTEENKKLKLSLEKYEAKELEDLVVSNIALGKIPAAKKSTYITLAKENRSLFDQLVEGTTSRPVVPNKTTKVSLSKESIVSKKSPDGLKDNELIGDYAKAVLAEARKTLKNNR